MVDLQKAVKGLVVFSPELETCSIALLANKVPAPWMGVSYPCLKPLLSYVNHYIDRMVFYREWIDLGVPAVFWFSAYFFQQAFLTGVMQNFARKDSIAIDRCLWNMEVLTLADSHPEQGPEYGSYVRGLFMDGARWDDDDHVIADSFPKVLWSELPNLWMKPCELTNDFQTAKAHLTNPAIMDGSKKVHHIYMAPVYKESLRRGVLSTSGHSSNFIDWFYLPIPSDTKEQLWTKRGVALITMTDE
jgi:dynein heavy chain